MSESRQEEVVYASYSSLAFDWPAKGVLRITLNRPERLNALDARGHDELARVWRDVDEDPRVAAVILCGAGKAFSAGGDFDMVEEMIDSFDARVRVWRESKDLVYNIINCSKPIVSAIHGSAVGAGLVAALLADISVAGRSARLVDGHTRLGVAAGDHAAIVWPLLCGMAKAKYHLMLCEPVNGEKAEQIGLVSVAVDDADVQQTALSIAIRLVNGAPSATRWTKYALNNWLRQAGPTFDASLALEMLGFGGEEVREGVKSFREKRAPEFPIDTPVSPTRRK
ncbi:enoyl-CoA hydratase [Burkholderia stabilis]|uniref:enoyl-CoA hydratase/isomerase family protein n=1 Tax=Burkholderia stabilis TaxID=95485 RepID=UPI0008518488|nr:enoyl-CoA hydratase/isomerase family protein [Burkholderia stabilis]AOR72845.1 enoyl-CoA hydratase [Burkholderia stabilis]HDR9492287.1 enoyl-CoA hydratase/isomerase family protein [Burkholderia stabilis]HDR9496435.1 enoyl-CoA hydratase/isomerase family protein [Burkholderia stabilis]HDR9522829.1 enoyl-CoA hydratase/isomerase family protein [Burkholderia stabilis]HDR9539899.1 enoyl-CoA hydratase/isomerase family protein [Burkholderia stabilis]